MMIDAFGTSHCTTVGINKSIVMSRFPASVAGFTEGRAMTE